MAGDHRSCRRFARAVVIFMTVTACATATAQLPGYRGEPHAIPKHEPPRPDPVYPPTQAMPSVPGYPPPAPLPQNAPVQKGSPLPPRQLPGMNVDSPTSADMVVDVRVFGNQGVTLQRITPHVKTRAGRNFDNEMVEEDVRRLLKTHMFVTVDTKYQRAPDGGLIVIFQVVERPTLRYVRYVGNSVKKRTLDKQTNLHAGDSADPYMVTEAKRKLEEWYSSKGYGRVRITIIEGDKVGDRGAVFVINEGQKQRVWNIEFEGNKIASDGRLKTQIKSKTPLLYLFKGEVDRQKIDEDVDRLKAYYRGLGYFRARIGRELEFNERENWMTLTFVIDEGPRYTVDEVSVIGNSKFTTEQLQKDLKLKNGEFFDQATMAGDLSFLQDKYGEVGYIFAAVEPDLRFEEEPGKLDLVYHIQEGSRYRIGRVDVEIAGENPRTRRHTVMNRISVRPGKIADIRELRDSERRLKNSGLFENKPGEGSEPQLVWGRPGGNDPNADNVAGRPVNPGGGGGPGGRGARGQSPDDVGPEDEWRPGPDDTDQPLVLTVRGQFKGDPAPPAQTPQTVAPTQPMPSQPTPSMPQSSNTPRYQPATLQPVAQPTRELLTSASGNRGVPARSHAQVVRAQSPIDDFPRYPQQQNYAQQPSSASQGYAPAQSYPPQAYGPNAQLPQTMQQAQPSFARTSPPPSVNTTGAGQVPLGRTSPDALPSAVQARTTIDPRTGQVVQAQYVPPAPRSSDERYLPPQQPVYAQPTSPVQPAQGTAPYGAQPSGQFNPYAGPPTAGGYDSPAQLAPGLSPQSPFASQPQSGVQGAPPAAGSPPFDGGLSPDPLVFSDEEPTVPIDVIAKVKETQTGRLMLGVGVNSSSGLVGQVVVEEQNFDFRRFPTSWEEIRNGTAFRGGGQQFRIQAMPGTQYSQYSATFREPYFLDTLVSFSLSGSFFNRYFQNWSEQRAGGRIGFGYQFTPDLSGNFALRGENVVIYQPTVPSPPQLQAALGNNDLFTARFDLIHDTRDSPFLPSQGHYIDLGYEQAFGQFNYPRGTIDVRQYFLLRQRPDRSGKHTLSLLNSTGFSALNTPIFENFFAGGYQTLRGFYFRGASPLVNGVQVGGAFQFINTIEYMFPITADDMLRGVAFTDFGTVEQTITMNANQFRVSPGLGLRIQIPAMGPAPIALDFAVPVAYAPGDRQQIFSFFVGAMR